MLNENIKTTALLVHVDSKTKGVEVTRHDVKKSKGGFCLGASSALSENAIEELVESLSNRQTSTPSLIPDTLLYQSSNCLIWYSKPQEREILFRVNNKVQRVTAVIPAHVFVYVDRRFHATAIKGRSRPTSATKLYNSPTGNCYNDHHVCTGNINLVNRYDLDYITELENFFYNGVNNDIHNIAVKGFDSHTVIDKLYEFWKNASEKKSNVSPSLVPSNKTLGDIFDRLSEAEV